MYLRMSKYFSDLKRIISGNKVKRFKFMTKGNIAICGHSVFRSQ